MTYCWKGSSYSLKRVPVLWRKSIHCLNLKSTSYILEWISNSFLSVIVVTFETLIEKYSIIQFIFVSYNLIGLWNFRCLKRFYVTNYMVGKSDSSALSLLLEKASKNNSYKRINSLNVHTHNIALHKSIYKYEVS